MKGTIGEGEMKYSVEASKYKKDGVTSEGISSGWDTVGRLIKEKIRACLFF